MIRILTREAKERLLKYYPKPEDEAHDAKTYGPNFVEALNAVLLPVGDPGRITSTDKLVPMIGHGITFSGYEKLLKK